MHDLTFVDPDLFEMADAYLMERCREFHEIPTLVQEGNFSLIEQIGHKLKGNAALFGLAWLGFRGADLEEFARAEQTEKILNTAEIVVIGLARVKFVPDESAQA